MSIDTTDTIPRIVSKKTTKTKGSNRHAITQKKLPKKLEKKLQTRQ